MGKLGWRINKASDDLKVVIGKDTINFYKKYGVAPRAIVMSKKN